MQIVEGPLPRFPSACLVSNRDDGQFIDFGVETPGIDSHLYLKVEVVEQAAQLIGMAPRAEVSKLAEDLASLSEKLDEAHRRIEAYEKVEEGLAALAEPVPA